MSSIINSLFPRENRPNVNRLCLVKRIRLSMNNRDETEYKHEVKEHP